jgi:hypothetical protein
MSPERGRLYRDGSTRPTRELNEHMIAWNRPAPVGDRKPLAKEGVRRIGNRDFSDRAVRNRGTIRCLLY